MRVESTEPGILAPFGPARALSLARSAAQAQPPTSGPTPPTLDAILSPADRELLARKREEGGTVMARLAAVEEKARTARRDALKQELQRLMEMAAALRKIADPRMAGNMAQTLARQIATIARQLAEAEQALPVSQRGAPPTAVAAPPATAAAQPAPETEAQPQSQPEPSTRPATTLADIEEARRMGRDVGREGTRGLLSGAADLLEELLEKVREAERWDAVLDPEAAADRRRAIRDIARDVAGLRALAGGLGGGVRLSA